MSEPRPLRRVVVATGNAGKLRELGSMLEPLGYEPIAQRALGIEPAEEPFGTFLENALAKARHAARASGLPALADDSGVCVPVLGGAPGVYSARYALLGDTAGSNGAASATDAANNARLVAELRRQGGPDRALAVAYYYCVLVWLRHADDPQPLVADGTWHGVLVAEPRGQGGFGYDPHFLIPGEQRTVAELTPARKNAISHRARAMRRLRAHLSRERAAA